MMQNDTKARPDKWELAIIFSKFSDNFGGLCVILPELISDKYV